MIGRVTRYTGSDGTEHDIALMNYHHLKAATEKLARSIHHSPERRPELEAMQAELETRTDPNA